MSDSRVLSEYGSGLYELARVGPQFTLAETSLNQRQLANLQEAGLVEHDGEGYRAHDAVEVAREHLLESEHAYVWWPSITQTDGSEGCCHGGIHNLDGEQFTCRTASCDARYSREAAQRLIDGRVSPEDPWGEDDD